VKKKNLPGEFGRQRGLEPLVGVPAVIGREVAHQADAARVCSGGEPRHGLITAEQRIDLAEGRGVVTVVRFGREERRQIDRANPERREIVQMLGDAIEIAAVPLARRVWSFADYRIIPGSGPGPRGGWALDRFGKPIGEDLVHRARRPLRRFGKSADAKVGRIGDIVAMQAGAVQPLITVWAAVEQPAIAHHRIDHTQFGAQPRVALILPIDCGTRQFRLAVAEDAHPGAGDIARSRDAQQDGDLAAEFGGGIGYVQRRAIVMRLGPGGIRHAVSSL
jgi:hypothetical protein